MLLARSKPLGLGTLDHRNRRGLGATAARRAIAAIRRSVVLALTALATSPIAGTLAFASRATILALTRRERARDERFVRPLVDQLEAIGLLACLLRRRHGGDLDPVNEEVGINSQDVAHLGLRGEHGGRHGAPRLSGASGPPCPAAVVSRACELDLDPARHWGHGSGGRPERAGRALHRSE